MRHADHEIVVTGIADGYLEYNLYCLHTDDQDIFFTDDEHTQHDECVVQTWWECDGRDVTGFSNTLTPQGHILLWTTWNFEGSPLLVGRKQYKQWREDTGYDQDQAHD
jgi:hypothetical protein